MRFARKLLLSLCALWVVVVVYAFHVLTSYAELNGWGFETDNGGGVLPQLGQVARGGRVEGMSPVTQSAPVREAKRASKNVTLIRVEEPSAEVMRGWDEQEVIGKGRPWQQFHRDISQDALYSEGAPYMEDLLRDLATVKIVNASQFRGGTQLKFDLRLADGNRVIAKPMRLSRDHVYKYNEEEPFWLEPERHNAEIASFHLDRLLGFRRVPPCTGRRVVLKKEILGRSDDMQLLSTIFKCDGNLCVIGRCKPWFCNHDHPSCTHRGLLEVSMCQFLPTHRGGIPVRESAYPWSQGIKEAKVWKGTNVCLDILKNPMELRGRCFLDLIEQGIFDFFLRNYDRHHYSQLRRYGKLGSVLHVDNGKGFGNPLVDDDTFLAPVYQCCKLRRSTYVRLKEMAQPRSLLSNLLNSSLSRDPVAPIITEVHLRAMDRRLETVLRTVDKCIRQHGENNVLVQRPES